MQSITIGAQELARDLDMEILTPCSADIVFSSSEINRPGLQFTGYYEHFAEERLQLVGNAEIGYLYDLSPEKLNACAERFMTAGIPCVVCARNKRPPDIFLEAALRHNIPVFCSHLLTGDITNRIIVYLQARLAPSILIHGVLLDVFGVGTLLRGPSGIGKSETALEMIKSGHTLVADDVVQIKRISNTLVGSAPVSTRNLIEIRGIGIMDIRHLYGVGAVQPEKTIDMILDLELWNEHSDYNRWDTGESTDAILGVKIPTTLLPVSPGRNLASIIGVAARSFRLKNMGYHRGLEFS